MHYFSSSGEVLKILFRSFCLSPNCKDIFHQFPLLALQFYLSNLGLTPKCGSFLYSVKNRASSAFSPHKHYRCLHEVLHFKKNIESFKIEREPKTFFLLTKKSESLINSYMYSLEWYNVAINSCISDDLDSKWLPLVRPQRYP